MKQNTKITHMILILGCVFLVGSFIIPVVSADIGPSVHPRLYFTPSELPAVKARMDQVSTKPIWTTIQRTAISFDRFPSTLTRTRLGDILTGLRYTSFTYAMTGDTTVGNKAKSYLLLACSWPSWTEPLGYNPSSTTAPLPYQMGVLTIGIAEAYDNLYPILTPAERKTVQDALITKAIIPGYNDYKTGRYIYSHGQTNRAAQCYGGIAVGALAIMGDTDDPNLNTYYLGLHAIMDDYFNTYDRDGAWSEGIPYESFSQADGSGAIYYIEALQRVKGEDLSQHPRFKNAMNYPVYFSPPDRKSASDSFNDASFETGYSGAATAWFTSTYRSGLAQWYYTTMPQQHSDHVGEFLWLNASVPVVSPATLPTAKHFQDLGLVALRTGWNTDDTFIGFLSGPTPPGDGHYRPEQNSFMLDALGEHLIIEPGMPSSGYSSYYSGTVSQNTILVNSDPNSQVYRYSRPPVQAGKVTRFFTSDILDTVTGSAATAYNGKLTKFNRTLIFAKPDYLVVFDDLGSAKGDVEFDSLLHALGTNSISVSGNTVTIAQNTAKLSGTILSPQDFRYSIQAGQPVAMDGANKPTSYIKIYPSTNSGQAQFLSVLYPQRTGDTAFPVSRLDGNGVTGARLTRNGLYDFVLIRTGQAGFQLGDIASDGAVSLIRNTSTEVQEVSLVDGRSLTLQGYQYYGSDSPSSAVLHYSTGTIDGRLQSTVPMTVRIHAAESPALVVVNGAALPTSAYAYDPDSRVLSFPVKSGESHIQVGKAITITTGNNPPVLATIGNKAVGAGSPQTFTVSATDPDSNTLTYSASNLPTGATFNPTTRSFAWTPTTSQVGTYTMTFQVTDGKLSDSEAVGITVTAGTTLTGSIVVTSPNGGETWIPGTTPTITWASSGSGGSYVNIYLLKTGAVVQTVSSYTLNDGTFSSWTIPTGQATGTDYRIRITSATNATITDTSTSNFAITAATITPSITVTTPNGGESWARMMGTGTPRLIQWRYTGNPGSTVKIELLKGGVFYKTLTPGTSIGSAGSGSYPWTISADTALGTDYKIRVSSTSNSVYNDMSNANVIIN